MNDRFGPVPSQVEDLFTTVRVRKMAVELGFERMYLKHETLKCFFVSNPDSPYFQSEIFNGLLVFLQTATNKAKLKQVGKNGIMVVENIATMDDLYRFLKKMYTSAAAPKVLSDQ
jgi:transcription-repair coupling factor (superfamily II helicase)